MKIFSLTILHFELKEGKKGGGGKGYDEVVSHLIANSREGSQSGK